MRFAISLGAWAIALTAAGEPWPAWRGPQGNGVSNDKQLPLHWSTNENVRWRAPLPDRGNSTPAVWGDRIFVTQYLERENRASVMCFSRKNGRLLWQKGVPAGEGKKPSLENPPCTPSPCTEGKRVIAWFGSAGVHCYDFAGQELWHTDLGRPTHEWGYASSPVLYRELCLLNFGPGQKSFVVALDKKSGKVAWRFEIPQLDAKAKWTDYGGDPKADNMPGGQRISEVAGSWATPLIVRSDRHDEVVVALALQLVALAPESGKELWSCRGPSIGAYSSPFFGEGIVGMAANGLQNTALAVRPGGHGDVTGTHRLWSEPLANSKGCIASGVIFQKHMFLVTVGGFAECLDLNTGQMIWDERLMGTGARNGCWASPILAGDKLYVANKDADVFVLRAAPRFECLATNSIGDEPMNASLAASDGEIFIRTEKALWCVGEGR